MLNYAKHLFKGNDWHDNEIAFNMYAVDESQAK